MLLVLCCLIAAVSGLSTDDPCTSHTVINEPKRDKSYQAPKGGNALCDNKLQPDWYVFKDAVIPTSCVQNGRCGTHVPIWMDGKIPKPSQGRVHRNGCLNVKGCCDETVPLLVKNCGSFIAYFLFPTKGCSQAYCSEGGSTDYCPPGEILISGVCKEKYPKIIAPPYLSGPEIRNKNFRFACHLQDIPSSSNWNIEVTWSFDGYEDPSIPKTVLNGNDNVVYLPERYWYGNLGKTLTCRIKSYFDGSPQNKSDPYESNGYWGGIKVTPSKVVVSESGSTEKITLTSTIPLHCHGNAQQCQLGMEFGNTDEIVGVHACTTEFGQEKWDPISKTASVSFDVLAVRDMKKDGNKNLAIKITLPKNYEVEHLWNAYSLPPIPVETIDKKPSFCTASGDPHITTFDRGGPYHLYKVGEFQFVKTSGKIPFEVQARTWTCVKKNPKNLRMCICGIVAREGNDVVKIDVCQSKLHHTWPKTEVLSGDLMHGTKVIQQQDGKRIMIIFASGAYVKCDIKSYGILLHVKAAPEHELKTLGICGTIDGDKTNDLMMPDGTVYPHHTHKPDPFFESWRIPRSQSLFDKVPPMDPKYNREPRYCKCFNSTGESMTFACSKNKKVQDAQTQNIIKKWHDITQQVAEEARTKARSATLDTDGYSSYPFDYGVPLYVAPEETWPTASGIIEAQAVSFCTKAVYESNLYHACQHELGEAFNATIEGCIEDILVSDRLDFVDSAPDTFDAHCEFEAFQDINRYTHTREGALVAPTYLTHRCPGNCNKRGVCNAGVCKCAAGSAGVDCSINSHEPPLLWEVTRKGLCDMRKESCRTAFVLADNLMGGPQLRCRLAHVNFDVHSGPTGTDDMYHDVGGNFIGYRRMSCPLPNSKGIATEAYFISVTNDGIRHSQDDLFLMYDSLCLDCSKENCSLKVHTCLIDSRCYATGESNPTDSNQVCDPTRSKSSWTTKYAGVPLGGRVLPQWDVWTKKQTGCICPGTTSDLSCACCQPGGVPCGNQYKTQCVRDGDIQSCGIVKPSPDNGVDGWTLSFSGCTCKDDPTDNSCVCCADGGCQCDARQKNQCVQCGHPETCGGKPEIFGPAFSLPSP